MASSDSKLERAVLDRLVRLGLQEGLQRDYVFHPHRKWELDFAWPAMMVYLSVEGGIGRSRHRGLTTVYRTVVDARTGKKHRIKAGVRDGYAEDLEKHTEAAIFGWIGVRVIGSMIVDGKAMDMLGRAIRLRREGPF